MENGKWKIKDLRFYTDLSALPAAGHGIVIVLKRVMDNQICPVHQPGSFVRKDCRIAFT